MPDTLECATSVSSWKRHDILYVAPSAWNAALSALQISVVPLLEVWADRGWPVIVRRRMTGEDGDAIPIGVPLPPTEGKHRIALTIPEDGVIRYATPPRLHNVMQVAPTRWQCIIGELIHLGAYYNIQPLVFGSLMWQYQTGLSYINAGSDLDVLWPVADHCNIAALVSGIADIEGDGAPRIDGEIVFSDGSAVNWRELHKVLRSGGPGKLLVKDMDGVRLVDPASLLGRG